MDNLLRVGQRTDRKSHCIQTSEKQNLINYFYKVLLFIIFSFVKVSGDTRSAWRYCNTRATLGRGDTQAYQDQGRGLNNSLKLM